MTNLVANRSVKLPFFRYTKTCLSERDFEDVSNIFENRISRISALGEKGDFTTDRESLFDNLSNASSEQGCSVVRIGPIDIIDEDSGETESTRNASQDLLVFMLIVLRVTIVISDFLNEFHFVSLKTFNFQPINTADFDILRSK